MHAYSASSRDTVGCGRLECLGCRPASLHSGSEQTHDDPRFVPRAHTVFRQSGRCATACVGMTVRDQPRMTLSRPQRTCWTGRTWVRPQRRGAGGQLPVRPSWSGVQDGRRRRHAVLVPVCWPRATPKRGAADGSIRRTGANEILRKYDVWGGIRNTQELPAPWSPLLYCGSLGHPSENATGLIYMRARYYDPVLGRFISEDPARDGGNWFAYAGNNPVGMVDPDGRFALVDLLTGADEEARAKLRELLSAQGAKHWIEHKLTNTMWGWAQQFEVALGEDAALCFGSDTMEIVGSTNTAGVIAFFSMPPAFCRWEAPHIQFVLDFVGTVAKEFL